MQEAYPIKECRTAIAVSVVYRIPIEGRRLLLALFGCPPPLPLRRFFTFLFLFLVRFFFFFFLPPLRPGGGGVEAAIKVQYSNTRVED